MNIKNKIPVILDTDIGGDIDDTWALGMMLKSPELDVKLVVSDTGDTEYRAKICAKMLEMTGRSEIPVAVGIPMESDGPRERQRKWVEGYALEKYPGEVFRDGVEKIIDVVNNSESPVTLICIGPAPNIAELLRREPEIARKMNFVGMFGSIRKQHFGKAGAVAEFNVVRDIPACQAIFTAPWKSVKITPLDTCGVVQLKGELFLKVSQSEDIAAKIIMDNYKIWLNAQNGSEMPAESSILYDTVAVHLAYSEKFLRMAKMGIRVTDDGFTVIDSNSPEISVAMDWLDLDAYHKYFVERLLSKNIHLGSPVMTSAL